MKTIFKATLLFLIFCFLMACDITPNNLKFDSEKWKGSDLRIKGRMFKDLRDSKILEGKTESEVENLLGKPISANPDSWVYKIDLGCRFGNTVWTYNLNVVFDKNTKTVQRVYEND